VRVAEAHQLQQPPPLARAAVRAGQVLVEPEQLVGRQPAGKPEQLREVADRRARLGRAGGRALDGRDAGAWPHQAAGDLGERRLPRAVRAEQSEELAGRDLEVHAPERHGGAVALLERVAAEGSGHRAQCRKVVRCR
jgi:hypothetical protein